MQTRLDPSSCSSPGRWPFGLIGPWLSLFCVHFSLCVSRLRHRARDGNERSRAKWGNRWSESLSWRCLHPRHTAVLRCHALPRSRCAQGCSSRKWGGVHLERNTVLCSWERSAAAGFFKDCGASLDNNNKLLDDGSIRVNHPPLLLHFAIDDASPALQSSTKCAGGGSANCSWSRESYCSFLLGLFVPRLRIAGRQWCMDAAAAQAEQMRPDISPQQL